MSKGPSNQPAAEDSFKYRGAGRSPALPLISEEWFRVASRATPWVCVCGGVGAHGPWRIQFLHSHFPSVDEGGYDGGSPDSCLNHTLDTGRQAGSSHWHQDI